MACTYTFNEIIELIDQSTQQEISILCDLIKEEKLFYSAFQIRVIAAALRIQLDHLQITLNLTNKKNIPGS